MLWPFCYASLCRARVVYSIGLDDIEKDRAPWDYTDQEVVAACHPVTAFLCPSDGAGPTNKGERGRTSYHLNRGDITLNWDWYEYRGAFSNGEQHKMSLTDILDGTSNTAFFSEACIGTDATARKVKGGQVALGAAFNNGHTTGWDNFYFTPSVCAAARGPSGAIADGYDVVTGDQQVGRRWADAHNPYTMFYTILPPNSPTCCVHNENAVVTTATSYHSGGVNGCMGDGSVRFVSETIDAGDQTNDLYDIVPNQERPQDYGGPSVYGVWGAMGTSSGGETIAL
ncbi:MAG: DUF1559 domain-containing protein [Thermoguttaceae bacterium]